MKPNPVVHFEIPAENTERMANFYTQAFGWKTNKLGPEMGNYVVVMTSTDADERGFPTKPGMINGGFYKRSKDAQYPSVVISVDNIREAMKKVEEAGGKIIGGQKLGEPDDIPGVGLFIAFQDTEGNRISILEHHTM